MTALDRAIAHPPRVPGVSDRSPVAGLDRRSLGFLDVLAQSVSAVAPSAAAITIPAIVAAVAGNATVWSLAGALILALLVGSTINQFTRRMSTAGSLYTFVSKGLGGGAAFFTATSMLIGYAFVVMFSLAGSGVFLATLIGHVVSGAATSELLVAVLIVALGALCFLVLARGIRLSTRVTLLVELGSVALIMALTIAMLLRQGVTIDFAVLDLGAVSPGNFATGVVLALMAFVGFESAATLGVEARRPFASIPRSIIWTVGASGALYLLASYSQLLGFQTLGRSITASASPINDLATAYGLPWMGIGLDASIAASFFACAIASTTALVRLMFSLARDGVIPAAFGRTHTRRHTPIVAVSVAMPVLTVVPVIAIALGHSVWGAMGVLLTCSVSGYITSYVLVSVAAFAFLRRIGELTFWVGLRALATGALLAVGLVVYLVSRSAGQEVVGVWVFLGVAAVGILLFVAVWRRKPGISDAIGVFDETISGDVLGGDVRGGDVLGGAPK